MRSLRLTDGLSVLAFLSFAVSVCTQSSGPSSGSRRAVRIKGKKKFSALSALVHAVDRSPRLCKYLLICMLAPSSFVFAARILLFCVVDNDGLLVRADPCEIVLGELLM
jgi:hypothetical protein